MRKKVADYLVFAALAAVGVMLILKQQEVSEAVTESLKSCAYRIIPSLFAMTVISGAVSKSGVVARLIRFKRLDADILTAFIFGNIGGYPVGAKMLAETVDGGRISREEAEEAICFCYGCGPAFAAGVAGEAVFGRAEFGIAALLAVILSNATMYAAYLIRHRSTSSKKALQASGFSTKLMTDSVNSAAGAMVGICAMIVFFSALKAILFAYFPCLSEVKYLAAILEISNIAGLSTCKGVSLVTVALLLGFGGLCVIMQIFSVAGGSFGLTKFCVSRLIALPLTAGYAFVIQRLLGRLGIEAAASEKIRLSQSPSLIPVICVAAMVFITLSERRGVSR